MRLLAACLTTSLIMLWGVTLLAAQDALAPIPLLKSGEPVDWWFVFKFNAESFPECGGIQRTCTFGGTVQSYDSFSQQFAFASSADGTLRQGGGCVGDTTTDPLGATFDQVYNGKFFYVLWNDQFYGDPLQIQDAPWGHSKGMLAWNDDRDGMVLQVSTPSWPASGSSNEPRQTDGNTLGRLVTWTRIRRFLLWFTECRTVGESCRKSSRSINAQAIGRPPQDAVVTKMPRVGLYRSWAPNIDEGWTRWILENYGFAPVTLRNGDIQAGHLRDRFDTIILPDAAPRQITEGFSPGTIAGEYAGGLGDSGADALRAFVRAGGTLIAFNNASLMAIESFGLPVTNVLQGLNNDQLYCSGSLLRVELRDTVHPALWGMPREPIVMFERGPAFETESGFRGVVLASYPRDRNPLASGYLLHPERIEGKVAALEVFYGDGRVYLYGSRPQWRGQSHGTYKLVFNAIYDSPSASKPTSFQKPAESASPQLESWRTVIAKVHADLAELLRENRAFFAARGPAAVEARNKLSAAVDQFEKDRIPEIEDAGAGLDDATRRKSAEYVREMRRAAADLRTKEFETAVDADGLSERYRLAAIEQEITPPMPPK